MPPFNDPKVAFRGVKERIESIEVQDDRLYAGTSTGTLLIFNIEHTSDGSTPTLTLLDTKKNFTRKSIEQIGTLRDINSLVVLSEGSVSLYPIPSLTPTTTLPQTRGALSFAVYATRLSATEPGSEPVGKQDGDDAETGSTYLAVGCRKKVVIYSWKGDEPREVKELALPHSPRAVAFYDHKTVMMAYTATEHAVLSIAHMSVSDIVPQVSTSTTVAGIGKGALGNLTGYMTLGLGAKAKPIAVTVSQNEVSIVKENQNLFYNSEGKPSRETSIVWPGLPEESVYIRPYFVSLLPAGSASSLITLSTQGAGPPSSPNPVLQAFSSLTLTSVQSLTFPFEGSLPEVTQPTHSLRVLTGTSSGTSHAYFVSTPTDRTLLANQGSDIWYLSRKSWDAQIDELVENEAYDDALALLSYLDERALPDKEQRTSLVQTLRAVSLFKQAKYHDSLILLRDLNTNPARVLALYPELISGRLAVPEEKWIELFGGPKSRAEQKDNTIESSTGAETTEEPTQRPPSPSGSVKGKLKATLDLLVPSQLTGNITGKDDDGSISEEKSKSKSIDEFRKSIEALLEYLPDRRQKFLSLQNQATRASLLPPLATIPADELLSLPNVSPSYLTPNQLLRFAQLVDTALFKSYLIIRPSLIGPLCRIGNWCEVAEVEELLRAREKFGDLVTLYSGKKMHDKALALLRELGSKEDDPEDRFRPTISYLQKLGPEYIDQVFESAHWPLKEVPDMAFEIFTSEDVMLPPSAVADYLETVNTTLAIRYIEYLIEERAEVSVPFHDRLAYLYLQRIRTEGKTDAKVKSDVYGTFLKFIESTSIYRPDHVFALLLKDEMYEARAILLGRLGRHEAALDLYVHRLKDYVKAEEYCKRVYVAESETQNVFLFLLKTYLQPPLSSAAARGTVLLGPALDLIARQSPRLDPVQTLNLLPPLVTAQSVKPFLIEALRDRRFDAKVTTETWKSRKDELSRQLMTLESNRVKVTDTRICPQCNKRLGRSVIAVHIPRGEVTHYTCREAFSQKINGRSFSGTAR
ncbi:hypothetical protein SISSUDRAFT_1113449 [Sistotremastrum suecicum HHB10207 ss-3]|uniref:CNH domain-containing protein n=1 Tax=Sistotremastrum suecicum HHB10207 ss-3 TaxID=1314776 RepID=A0A166EV01_9AGAM|nr:hypothetical protein SISSUDRAFT_1113449 [Sistotremastrum suecicum HHB10207 ss-3]